MTTDSLRNVKDRFPKFADRVDRERQRIVITRNGRPTAVLISPDDLDSLEETPDLMGEGSTVHAAGPTGCCTASPSRNEQ